MFLIIFTKFNKRLSFCSSCQWNTDWFWTKKMPGYEANMIFKACEKCTACIVTESMLHGNGKCRTINLKSNEVNSENQQLKSIKSITGSKVPVQHDFGVSSSEMSKLFRLLFWTWAFTFWSRIPFVINVNFDVVLFAEKAHNKICDLLSCFTMRTNCSHASAFNDTVAAFKILNIMLSRSKMYIFIW